MRVLFTLILYSALVTALLSYVTLNMFFLNNNNNNNNLQRQLSFLLSDHAWPTCVLRLRLGCGLVQECHRKMLDWKMITVELTL